MPHLGSATQTYRPAPQVTQVTGSITATGATSNHIWTVWNEDYGSTTTVTGTTSQIWTIWVQQTTGTGTITVPEVHVQTPTITGNATNGVIWTRWNSQHVVQDVAPPRIREATPEEVQARLRREEEQRAQQAALAAETERAKERAVKLLHENLSAQQREQLAQNGYFELESISKNGERKKYRIHRKWSHSIQQVHPDTGARIKTLCIHPREATPVEDSMLAQKLMLEGGMEDELLRIANHS